MTLSKETIGNVIEKLEHFSQNLKWTDVRGAQDLLAAADGLRELLERRERAAVELAVWYGSMPESNGKTNWTAIVHRKDECISKGITIDRSEYPDRVRYEADRVRYLIGELADKPWITSYDANKHSGYVAPRPEPVVPKNLPCPVLLEPGLRFGKGVPTQTMLDALQRRAEYYAELEAMTPEQRADHDAGMKEFAAMLQSFGNSEQLKPVSQTYTLRDGLAAIRKLGPIDAEKIQAERDALNEPMCWCLTCRPVTMTDMRFVVCPECGNKRCPKANYHRNTCSGSNESGQDGSAYPAAPKQESE